MWQPHPLCAAHQQKHAHYCNLRSVAATCDVIAGKERRPCKCECLEEAGWHCLRYFAFNLVMMCLTYVPYEMWQGGMFGKNSHIRAVRMLPWTQLCLSVFLSVRVASCPLNMILTFVTAFQSLLNRTSHAEQCSSRRCLEHKSLKFIWNKIVPNTFLCPAHFFVRLAVLETAKQKLLQYCVIPSHSDSFWIHFEREVSSALLPAPFIAWQTK